MNRYFIKLAYSGSDYHGWQLQPNAITIQQEVNNALSLILREEINVAGAGRTDTGVHASDFYAHFDIEKDLGGEKEFGKLLFKLNGLLPKAISIYNIFKVDNAFHARFSAISRTYKYYVAERKNPFIRETSYLLLKDIDIDRMNSAAKILVEYDDFKAFSKLHTERNTNLCKIMHAEWKKEGECVVFTIKANRFLRNMVRAIVGTLLEIGLGKLDVEDMRRIIISKKRSEAGYSVPAKGLFLTDIEYDFSKKIDFKHGK